MSSNRRSQIVQYLVLPNLVFFPGDSVGKESAYNTRDPDQTPRWEISAGEGKGNPLWYSCLENPMDRGTWWATVHGVTKSQT